MKRNHGYLLFEVLIVLMLVAIAFTGFRSYQQRQFANRQQERILAEYVNDYTSLMRAVRHYTGTRESGWAANSVNVITVAQLVAAGELPTGFGTRPTGTNQTVLGQTIRIVAIRNAAATRTPTVVTETGTANGAMLELAGLRSDGADLLPFKRRAAAAIAATRIVAGTVAPSVLTVTGAGTNGWTKDVTAYFAAAPTQAVVAGMVGFPDLDLLFDPNPTANGGNWGDCPVAKAAEGMFGFPSTTATCPAGTTEVGSWPACGGTAGVYSVGFTSVTISASVDRGRPAMNVTCSPSTSGSWGPPCNSQLMNGYAYVQHTINNAIVSESLCGSAEYVDQGILVNWPTFRQAPNNIRHKLCCYPKP
jgi:type II secretory pathway pseudopilin PulG